MRYRRKPVEVDAIQWTGENWAEVLSFVVGETGGAFAHRNGDALVVDTMDRQIRAGIGDWIVRERLNEYSPLDTDAFYRGFEEVEPWDE